MIVLLYKIKRKELNKGISLLNVIRNIYVGGCVASEYNIKW